jgi:hypothetical protein
MFTIRTNENDRKLTFTASISADVTKLGRVTQELMAENIYF